MIARILDWFSRLLSGPDFSRLSGMLARWCLSLGFASLLAGVIWGLGFAPVDYQQGDSYRIIFIHVPSAFIAMSGYAFMAGAAVIALIWRTKLAESVVTATAPVGAAFAFLALLTGSLWGKPMWGAYWAWDARLTSVLILFFIYLGIMALNSAYDDARKGARAASLLVVVGVVNLPIIHYSVEWWNSLHQGSTLKLTQASSIDPAMLHPLLLTLLGTNLLFFGVILIRSRARLLERERRKHWASEVAVLLRTRSRLELGATLAMTLVGLAWLVQFLSFPPGPAQMIFRQPAQIEAGNVDTHARVCVGGLLQQTALGWQVYDGQGSVPLEGAIRWRAAPAILLGHMNVDGTLRADHVRWFTPRTWWWTMGGYGFFVWTAYALFWLFALGLLRSALRYETSVRQRILAQRKETS